VGIRTEGHDTKRQAENSKADSIHGHYGSPKGCVPSVFLVRPHRLMGTEREMRLNPENLTRVESLCADSG
jgi:hypothetical protein